MQALAPGGTPMCIPQNRLAAGKIMRVTGWPAGALVCGVLQGNRADRAREHATLPKRSSAGWSRLTCHHRARNEAGRLETHCDLMLFARNAVLTFSAGASSREAAAICLGLCSPSGPASRMERS